MTLTAIRRATVNSTDRRHAQEEVVMTTTQDLPRAFARLARCGSHRVVVLVAGLARRGVGALRRLLLVMLLKRPVVVGLAIAGIGSRAELRDRDARRLHERTIFDVGNDLSGFGRQIDSKAVARKPTDQVAAKRSVVVRGAFGHAIPEAPRIAKDNDLRCLPSRRPGHRCDAAVIVGTCLVENANIARIDEIGELDVERWLRGVEATGAHVIRERALRLVRRRSQVSDRTCYPSRETSRGRSSDSWPAEVAARGELAAELRPERGFEAWRLCATAVPPRDDGMNSQAA